MHSLRTQITIITIVAILTGILSVFTASFLIVRGQTDKDSVEMMNLIDEDARKSLEKYFESIEQSVEIAANIATEDMDSVLLVECGAVRNGSATAVQTEEQKKALDRYLNSYCGKIQEFYAGVADYTQGVTAYFYCIDPEISRNARGFYYMKIGKTGFIEQESLNIEHLKPVESLHATWYEAAVGKGRPAWVGPYISTAEQGQWIFSYFVPIYKAGMLIGIMGMDIPCETLIAQVSDIRVYDTGFVALIGPEGEVIYHPDLSIGGDLDELNLNIRKDLLKNDNSGEKLIRYKADGEDRQMSFSTLSNGMKLICIAPENEINAPWIKLIRVIVLITVFVIIFFIAAVLFLMRVITSPLIQLTSASQRLADADYDVDLSYHGANEIGTLTGSFVRMRDQLRQYIEDLNHQIYHDRLTDLPNMRFFFALAEKAKRSMASEGKQSVTLHFNIVGLKYFNRQYGFYEGDRLIKDFAGIISRRFGEERVCRFNGDQFAAVTEEDTVDEDLKAVLQEWDADQGGMRLPICIGVYPNRLDDVDVNVACDRAKYAGDRNKNEHASSIAFFDESMLKTGEISTYIIHHLDQALEEGWVQVYYQPIIRAADGKICDEEALARWFDPVYGFLSPGDFIPALEGSKLIYKLDLYVLEQVLEKMKKQEEAGFYLVPQSVNLSRMDFESCDIVEEIRRRVDDAGIDRSMITVEITESVIGGDFDFMKEQVARFRELGFPVWMDDFGSGYSSLDVLQQIHFDLIKFDMRFMERFDEGDESKIILTELMRMAISLGMETVCEGVEYQEQVEFLQEIGCTRIQGYYYGKPIPFEGILSLFEKGTYLEYENPEELDYYSSIGRINLYGLSALANDNDESLTQYFDTLPMCIMEVSGSIVRFNRCNRSYREFCERTLNVEYNTEDRDFTHLLGRQGPVFLKEVLQCSRTGNRAVVDERLNEKTVIHSLIRRVAVNQVTGTTAIAVAVLAVSRDGDNAGADFSRMVKALTVEYVHLYYVDLETGDFTEYSTDSERDDVVVKRHGEDFFAASRRDAMIYLHKDDRERFAGVFTRENVVKALDTEGQFKLTYRLMMEGKPVYVDLKAVNMPGDPSHIIVGVNDVDVRKRQEEEIARIQSEKTIYSRIRALTQGLLCIYTVDPSTGHYMQYLTAGNFEELSMPSEGDDFWAQAQAECDKHVYTEDIEKVRTLMTRENVMRRVEESGSYAFRFRALINQEPGYVNVKAVLVEEENGSVLIVGVNDIDEQIKHEQEYERQLISARSKGNLDTLTGVKNRTAYESMSETLVHQIEEGQNVQYAIAICRVHGLGWINETQGRTAGNELIREACGIICETFKHSPVFRVTGDKFAVIAQGHDYEHVDELVAQLEKNNHSNSEVGGPLVSCGIAKYDGTGNVSAVFDRAEMLCNSSG